MRKSDKKKNMAKANLIAETRHLESKGIIKENVFHADGVNELDIDTYAKVRDTTADRNSDKQTNVNKLSQEGFEREFYNQYPKGVTKLVSENGTYLFDSIKWNSNYSSYGLMFLREGDNDMLWIVQDSSAPKGFSEKNGKDPNFSPGAEELLRTMFKHHINLRGNDMNEMEPMLEDGGDNEFDLRNNENVKDLLWKIRTLIGSYTGTDKTADAAIANDNKVIIANLIKSGELGNYLSQLTNDLHKVGYAASDDPMISAGKGIWSNNHDAMRNFMSSVGMNPDEHKIVSRDELR